LSDDPVIASRLEKKFAYQNMFYDREPILDVTAPDAGRAAKYDFIVSSDIFEHVPPPVERVFENVFAMLKRGGLLVLTVPFAPTAQTIEHFPNLHDYRLIEEEGGTRRLENRTRDGEIEVFRDLAFHGGCGEGSTLEMRVFARDDLDRLLRSVGFEDVELHDEEVPEYGIAWLESWSLPITARKPLVL